MKALNRRFSRAMALLLAVILTFTMLPTAVFASGTASETVYVTISKDGSIVNGKDGKAVAETAVTLTGKDTYNIDDALKAVHEQCYKGGAAAGYASENKPTYGLSLKTLWGETTDYVGYQVDSGAVTVMNLEQHLTDGQTIDAYVLQSAYPDTEAYSFFDKTTASVKTGETLTLTLKQAGYDANWNRVFPACSGAALTIDGTVQSAVTDTDGKASLTFHKAGTYVVSAEMKKTVNGSSVTAITAPVCVVTVALSAADAKRADIYRETGDALAKNDLTFGTEWIALGLARSGRSVSEGYYDSVASYVKANANSSGQLSTTKSTENSRTILALTAIGKDPSYVDGINLLQGLNTFSYLTKQGLNGPIWALLAMDSNQYEVPAASDSTETVTRDKLVEYILGKQLTDGGWALFGKTGDPDITAMVLQALAPYVSSNTDVKAAVNKGLTFLSGQQQSDGGYISSGNENCESSAQVIIALTALGVNPAEDSRFIKNKVSVLDALCSYYTENGTFAHTIGGGANSMAAVQAYEALTAYDRFIEEKSSLFSMKQSIRVSGEDRYETAEVIVRKAFPDGCNTAVLASGANWPDALAASSLAGAEGCPVILTEPDKLTEQASELLTVLGVKNVLLVGGTAAVTDQVKASVEAMKITADRIFGDDRTKTADQIEKKVAELSTADTCIICSGNNYPDALAISSYAYTNKFPILLTGADGKLTDETLAIAGKFKKAMIIGLQGAVSADVDKQLKALDVVRYGGEDRYATSLDILTRLYGGKVSVAAAATGENYPDALAGASLSGKNGGSIVLINGNAESLNEDQKQIIRNAGKVWILGGENAVSVAAKTAVDEEIS
ncbi:MAG: cell wall-binding repeat-containing protein [Lachnospiraceae bacterium]|jgi:putative cell wall-binding protein|nr:cell wall-binding repeat-containing protein [Lachnospiraceae bacterium]